MSLAKDMKKPLDAGFKRNLMIIGAAVVVSGLVIGGLAMLSGNKKPKSTASETRLTGVIPNNMEKNSGQISPAMQERLARVQQQEAIAAYRAGDSYVPENTLGTGRPVTPPTRQPVSAPASPGPSAYRQFQSSQQRTTGSVDPLAAQRDLIAQGLERQLAQIAYVFEPAETQDVQIKPAAKTNEGGLAAAGTSSKSADSQRSANKTLLIPGLQIVPGRLESPINTDKSQFVSVSVTAGPLAGAYLIGQSKPMTLSGDVEDVGVQLTQMRFNNQLYPIDAILLNEQTASDVMNADIDRHIFSKQVLPVIMAGLSGLSTFFTAQGQTGMKYSPTAGVTGQNIIVDQPKASREEAKQQGIGEAIGTLVDNGNDQVSKMQQRPNTATVDAYTTVGVLFRQPVYQEQAK